jgi:hypothetical protein
VVSVIWITPEAPSMVTVWPVTNRVVASGTQIIAGIPYSRDCRAVGHRRAGFGDQAACGEEE